MAKLQVASVGTGLSLVLGTLCLLSFAHNKVPTYQMLFSLMECLLV